MTKKQAERIKNLLPNGIPKHIRVYDNGGETADRFMVVFTGRYGHKTGKNTWILTMSAAPFSPQGVGIHSTMPYNQRPDVPTYSHLGKKIKFTNLPEDCQKCVLQDYKYLWDLTDEIHPQSIDPFEIT